MPTPVLVICGLDATDQEVAALGLQCDLPGAAVVRIEVDGHRGRVAWRVSDVGGVVEEDRTPVAHPCMSCSMREAILPALARLAGSGRWSALVVMLPAGAEPMPMSLAIARGEVAGRSARELLDLRSVLAVVSGDDLCAAVFDDPLLAELGLALVPDDRRAYGEALAAQLEFADAIALRHDAPDESDRALLDHLRRPESTVHLGLEALASPDLLAHVHDSDAAAASVDPRRRRATGATPAGGLVTVELESWKAFHPGRLLDRLEELGAGEVRGRGAFWLPGRPGAAIAWECSGAQLSIGGVGPWTGVERTTRIVATTDAETAGRMRAAFEEALMTDAEMLTARERWLGRRDGFEDWLGDVEAGAA